ncbi:AAC(3) family N-acetyltransferase [Streptomyces sp. NBC_01190]|uniref:AAC(3) family N-acetyltransferase n=1 Tax=Streptomyces sp. NBC_01190 TaxID=2903767 RepID=UPI00386CB421|nr:AAC(3) family N-acetyltransferase [Streptomyces sp. NBC_01190]
MPISTGQLTSAMDDLGLADRPVMVHSSLRSFGDRVDGGADALLDLFLARGCTVLVPTFSESQFGAVPPAAMRPERNAIDYAELPADAPAVQDVPEYTVDSTVVNEGMGILPARLLARPDAERGRHPLNSFAALGPQAHDLIAAQSAADVYGPLRELAGRGGAVLLMGVGLDRMTLLHHAEQASGRRLLVRWACDSGGRVFMVETGSCSEGFPRLEPVLRPLARTARVGESGWAAYPAKEVIDAARDAMCADQTVTRCADDSCLRCRDSIAGGPVGPAPLACPSLERRPRR